MNTKKLYCFTLMWILWGIAGIDGQTKTEIIKSGDLTVLMADRAELNGNMKIYNPEPVANVKRFWVENWTNPSESFKWNVKVGKGGKYKIYFLISGSPGTEIEISGSENTVTCQLTENGWDKLEAPGELIIRAGINSLIVKCRQPGNFKLKSVEMINMADLPAFRKKIEKFRSDSRWMAEAGGRRQKGRKKG